MRQSHPHPPVSSPSPFLPAHLAPNLASSTLTPAERRSSFLLASIIALRMLGLFLVLPVFALEAARTAVTTRRGWV